MFVHKISPTEQSAHKLHPPIPTTLKIWPSTSDSLDLLILSILTVWHCQFHNIPILRDPRYFRVLIIFIFLRNLLNLVKRSLTYLNL